MPCDSSVGKFQLQQETQKHVRKDLNSTFHG